MFGQQRRGGSLALATSVLFVLGLGLATESPGPVSAAGTCSAAPYLAQGASTSVANVLVTATVNTAKSVGGQPTYYLHQSVPASTTPALDTTWTFSPGISEVQFTTIFHADGSSPENYAFTAKNSSGGTVRTFDITDVDGSFRYAFSAPVTEIVTTYTPTSGIFGSYLIMSLSSEPGACGAVDRPATVRAPSGTMTAGATPPTLTATAFVTGPNPETPVTFMTAPTCGLEDGLGNPVVLSRSTPVGTYVVVCVGGTATGFELLTYLDGVFAVEEYRRGFPEDYLERRLAAEASLLPDTR